MMHYVERDFTTLVPITETNNSFRDVHTFLTTNRQHIDDLERRKALSTLMTDTGTFDHIANKFIQSLPQHAKAILRHRARTEQRLDTGTTMAALQKNIHNLHASLKALDEQLDKGERKILMLPRNTGTMDDDQNEILSEKTEDGTEKFGKRRALYITKRDKLLRSIERSRNERTILTLDMKTELGMVTYIGK